MYKKRIVLFLAKRKTSASTRYRCLNYFSYLQDADWLPEHINTKGSIVKKITILKKVMAADVVVIARKTFSFPFRFLVRIFAKKIVFDFDDAIFVKSSGKDSFVRMNRFKSMLKKTDIVWAGNGYLAENAEKYCSSVDIIPTAVNCDKYTKEYPKAQGYTDIVWIGSSSTKKYLEKIIPLLDEVAKNFPDIRLKIIADFDLETQFIKTCPVAWTEKNEAKEIATSHIGIAMMSDDPWSNGKCGLKVIQYMAASLPVVATKNGVHPEIIEHEKSGLLVTSPSEWIKALTLLIKDKDMRESFGQRGCKIANEKYSLKVTSKTVIKHLNHLTK